MKAFICLLLTLTIYLNLKAQQHNSFSDLKIISASDNVWTHSDIDNNQLIDVIFKQDSCLKWVKNLGGGAFSEPDSLTTVPEYISKIVFSDVNGDGHKDLLYLTNPFVLNDHEFAEASYKLNSQQGYTEETKIISTSAKVKFIFFSDLDGDLDMDIIAYYSDPKRVSWFENENDGKFSDEKILIDNFKSSKTFEITRYYPFQLIDFDGDDDIDVFSVTKANDTEDYIANFYINQNQDFSHIVSDTLLNSGGNDYEITSTNDLNGDQFSDILMRALHGNLLVYYSIDGESFSSPELIYNYGSQDWTDIIGVTDIDNDKDPDILICYGWTEGYNQEIFWLENENNNFTESHKISSYDWEECDIQLVDLNNDNYLDITTISFYDSFEKEPSLVWYKNQNSINTNNEINNSVPINLTLKQNYPNPFNPTTHLVFTLDKSQKVFFKIYDLLGRQVAEIFPEIYNSGEHEVKFDASNLSSGVYFYQIIGENFKESDKFTLIE